MKTREDAAAQYCEGKFPASEFNNHYNYMHVHNEHRATFIAGCEHEAEKYRKLVELAKRLQANRTFSAVAEVELDQILEGLGMKNKPDKYCAWHPEKGWLGDEYLLGMRSDFDDALEELREAFETEFQEACDKIGMDRDFVPWIRAQGWEIRPVWLSTEPPLEWISVEDELPPMRERVLVWNSKQVYLVSRQFLENYYNN